MSILDLAGHASYIILCIGQLLVTRKQRCGWLLRIAGTAGWCVIGVYLEMTSVVVWGILFACIDARGWWAWR